MTDLEISKQLALAIGWPKVYESPIAVWVSEDTYDVDSRPFDYRDWAVAGPIAEKFDCFPQSTGANTGYAYVPGKGRANAEAPQRAIALAVIAGAKK